jgi:hypothetical protein
LNSFYRKEKIKKEQLDQDAKKLYQVADFNKKTPAKR